jgi:hypothetical protein
MSLPQPTVSTHSSCLTLILKLKPLHNHSSSNSTLKQDSVSGSNDDNYPTGDFEFKPVTSFHKFIVKLRTLMADSSEHVQHGSVLKITLRGQVFHSPSLILFIAYCISWFFISFFFGFCMSM